MQHYSAQMQYNKAIQSQNEPAMEKDKMASKFQGVVMLKQFSVSAHDCHICARTHTHTHALH